MLSVVDRLERLERENFRLKCLAAVVLSIAVVAVSCGAAFQNTTADIVRSKRFELVDGSGKVHVLIGELTPATTSSPSRFGVAIQDSDGTQLARLYNETSLGARFELLAKDDGRALAELYSSKDTSMGNPFASLSLRDRATKSLITLGNLPQGTGLAIDQVVTQAGQSMNTVSFYSQGDHSSMLKFGSAPDSIPEVKLISPINGQPTLHLGPKTTFTGQ